jgi:uncharacterized Tic20 family protein
MFIPPPICGSPRRSSWQREERHLCKTSSRSLYSMYPGIKPAISMNELVKSQDRTWEVVSHISSLAMLVGVPFGNIVGPLVVWLIKRKDSPSVEAHAKEALNFQISVMLYLMIAVGGTASLMLILIGILLIPLLIMALFVVPIVDIVFVVIASVKASNGEFYRYPLTLRLIK